MTACFQERVRILCDAGTLAGELAYGEGRPRAAGLLVNPHPYMGGTMGNNIIAAASAALAAAGLVALRFDYAGVGDSEGPAVDLAAGMAEFWATGKSARDDDMVHQVAAAAGWLRGSTRLPIVLFGYSFGAHATQAALGDDVLAAILVSPTVVRHDLADLARAGIPRLVIYSDNDFATPRGRTEAWLGTASPPCASRLLAGGNHFFKGQEAVICDLCIRFLAEHGVPLEGTTCRS